MAILNGIVTVLLVITALIHRYRSAPAGRIQWPGCDCGRRRDVLWKEQGEVDGG